jgi:hypothetical protein
MPEAKASAYTGYTLGSPGYVRCLCVGDQSPHMSDCIADRHFGRF